MHRPSRTWTVRCAACTVTVGEVVSGRFVHDPDCPFPPAIGGSTMRCCRCGGALTGERRIDAEQVADAVENTRASRADAFEDDDQLLGDDAPPQLGDILQFARPGGGPRPARRSQGSRAPW